MTQNPLVYSPLIKTEYASKARKNLGLEIRMKKSLLCVLLCLMGCFALSACGDTGIPDPYGIMEPTQALREGIGLIKPQKTEPTGNTQAKTEYCIVVDDGLGMKGFVAPFCMSYRAAISAVTSVSINSARACYRASEFPSISSEYAADTFFQNAVQDQFFASKSNDIASVIKKMAENYQKNPERVMILISDLMIPTEDDCMQAANALQSAVIEPEHATLGLIGIQADFRGMIENLPISPTTGYKRKISDYMVLEREADGNIRHPLYMLFFGNDQAVLSAMQKSLSTLDTCNLLDESTPHYSLYFSEYGVKRREVDDISNSFQLGCQRYNLGNYPAEYLIRGVESKNGDVAYPSLVGEKIAKEDQQLISDLHIAKIYDVERGNAKKNVKIRCTVPFTLVDSSTSGGIASDKYNLLVSADKLKLAPEDYVVSTEIRMLDYAERSGAKPQASWAVPDTSLVYCESAVIDETKRKIDVVLSVNTDLLVKDVPLLCTVGVRVSVKPQWEEIGSLYDTQWVEDMTLNLKEFDKESISFGKTETSARFTYKTTAKTPFLSNLICVGLGDQQTERVMRAITEKTASCVQTTMFGMVVRDVPGRYLPDGGWIESDNFLGWAFSIEEAKEIQAAIK